MRIRIGESELEWGTSIWRMRDSTALLGDGAALLQRLNADGYVRLRGVHDRMTVLEARRRVLEYMRDHGDQLAAGTPLMDGVINPHARALNLMGNPDVTHAPAVLAVLEGARIVEVFEALFGEPVLTFGHKWLRQVGQGGFTGAHVDRVYMGRGSQRLLTCWTPLGDLRKEEGTLAICEASHRQTGFRRVRETYGNADVDRDKLGGWFSRNPVEIAQHFGGRWVTDDFNAGDIVIIGMQLMHGSTTNVTHRWRISCDTRFQPASDPADERWVGPTPSGHTAYGSSGVALRDIEKVRAEWGV